MELSSNISAVVTGGASGLGGAVVDGLLAKGVKVAILDINTPTKETDAVFCQTDVTDPESVMTALEKARKANGQERICVNCAGIAPAAKTVSRGAAHDAALFQKVINVNLVGSFNVSSQSALGMSKADTLNEDGERGVIINTASVAAFEGQIGQIAYGASKGGVAAMTIPMARDLAKLGIRVMAIAPGIFGTPMVTAFPQDVQDSLASNIPFPNRLGSPNEFAKLAMHIAENSFLNGEVIRLDGATRMQPR
ncbi:SDR family NAD(P)-dependent oxidoreductase [Amylibacter sp. SFDW26]|uniref:SDR family NAD(P)-dependent oxidoreductase n=1 Tax=Amylibacter sp. SFDW26 TaxID=2652722 RepID=UPI0012618134|nr:SDR family NAD(P)-dependent oxidoreductase [Amylibacter sp. SFDW26]KAB7613852.1 SDR family NAD(P)-dependent oxidoreductase [Amylibacter sp. SFDW26]